MQEADRHLDAAADDTGRGIQEYARARRHFM
jgi:hypothetical protein